MAFSHFTLCRFPVDRTQLCATPPLEPYVRSILELSPLDSTPEPQPTPRTWQLGSRTRRQSVWCDGHSHFDLRPPLHTRMISDDTWSIYVTFVAFPFGWGIDFVVECCYGWRRELWSFKPENFVTILGRVHTKVRWKLSVFFSLPKEMATPVQLHKYFSCWKKQVQAFVRPQLWFILCLPCHTGSCRIRV